MGGPPPYATTGQRVWYYAFRVICGLIFFFLIAPIVIIIPLSFNAQDFFTFTPEMLRLDPDGFSLKHYRDFFNNNEWQRSFKNSLIIAPIATIISVSLGTLAAIGLSQSHVPGRRAIMAVLISPMIVPLIISATGMFFFYSDVGRFLEGSLGMSKTFVGYVKVFVHPQRALKKPADIAVEKEHAGRGDNQRHNHRRDQDRHNRAARRDMGLTKANRGQGAKGH